jgi:hypothetical protein
MWHSHLISVVQVKTQISELDSILGKKEEEIDQESLGIIKFIFKVIIRFKLFAPKNEEYF